MSDHLLRIEIHLHSCDNCLEVISRQLATRTHFHELRLHTGQWLCDFPTNQLTPTIQAAAAIISGHIGSISKIINHTAKGIENAHVAALFGRKNGESEREIGTAAMNDLLGGVRDGIQRIRLQTG